VRRQNNQFGAEAGVKTGSRAEEAMYESNRRSGTPSNPVSLIKQTNPSTAALIDQGRSIAEGLYGRAEALGINKAVFSALGDLKVRRIGDALAKAHSTDALPRFSPNRRVYSHTRRNKDNLIYQKFLLPPPGKSMRQGIGA